MNMSEGREAENPFKGIEGWAGSLLSASPAAITPTPTLCRRGCVPAFNSSIQIISFFMACDENAPAMILLTKLELSR